MTKCQKITFFDIFHKICQNHTFPLFPIFPKNQKITFFHCDGDFCKIPNFPIFPKMPIFGISWILAILGISWKMGFSRKWPFLGFWRIFQKWPILGFLGKWSKMGFSGDTPKMVIFGRSRCATSPTRTIWRGVSYKLLGSLSIFF